MRVPLFELAAAAPAVTALLGAPPAMRFYEFGTAAERAAYPYVVWQVPYGSTQNYLDRRPDIDNVGVQFDVYAATASQARAIVEALRGALELAGHVVSLRGESWEPGAKVCRSSFDMEFWLSR